MRPLLLLAAIVFAVAGSYADTNQGIPLHSISLGELQEIFDLARARPTRARFLADITVTELQWSEAQILEEIKRQQEIMREREKQLTASQAASLYLARSNAIARSHSGTRTKHLEEWYSGGMYRVDQLDESFVSETYLGSHSNRFSETRVNLHNPAFSDYMSFSVDHILRCATLTKDPQVWYEQNDLWQAVTIDKPVAAFFLIALADRQSLPVNPDPSREDNAGLSALKMDSFKVTKLISGEDPVFSLCAFDDFASGFPAVQYRLSTKSDKGPQLDALLWVGRTFAKAVCVQAAFTNRSENKWIYSRRENIDSNCFPRVMVSAEFSPISGFRECRIEFKEVEVNPAFSDEEVFAPRFPTNYNVSAVVDGKRIPVQRAPYPASSRADPRPRANPYILALLALVACAPVIILLKRR